MEIDLMILFNGFVKNYINLGLKASDKKIDVINQENKYFVTLGKLLGFFVTSKKNIDGSIELNWYENEINNDNISTKINIVREVDLTKDLLVVHELINKVNENNHIGYILILEVSSYNRIDFLNKIIKTSLGLIKNEILIIYVIRDVIKNIIYYYSYLFKDSGITKNKIGFSYLDNDGNYKAIFKI